MFLFKNHDGDIQDNYKALSISYLYTVHEKSEIGLWEQAVCDLLHGAEAEEDVNDDFFNDALLAFHYNINSIIACPPSGGYNLHTTTSIILFHCLD